MIQPSITILDNEFVTIWCYPTKGIVHHQFHRYVFGDEFRNILIKAVEAFEEHHCTKWLSDDRHFGAILPDDKKWGDDVWRPRILAAGWKYWAMVLPGSMTGQLNLTKMVGEYDALGVVTTVKTTPEDAIEWLLSHP